MKKISLVTFATSNWKCSPQRISQQISIIQNQIPLFDKVMMFNETHLPKSFYDRFYCHLTDHAFALFAWKPCIILEALKLINNDDFLMYIDGGSSLPIYDAINFSNVIDKFKNKISDANINIGVGHCYNEGDKENIRIVKKKILDKFGLLKNEKFLHDYPHYEAGAWIIKKTKSTIQFMSDWYKFIYNNYETCIKSDFYDKTGEYPEFIHNGSDQAVLQCMLFKEDGKFCSLGTFFYDFGINTRIKG